MLTQEWIENSLPKTIKTDKDYERLIGFLQNWKEQAGSTQDVYDFLKTTNEKNLQAIQVLLSELASSLCDYNIKHYEELNKYFSTIQEQLTAETKNAISLFLTRDCTSRLAAVNAINNIIELMSI